MLRPGDLVTVDLSDSDFRPGYYVPMSTIYEEAGDYFVFWADESGEETIARRIPVEVHLESNLGSSTMRRITSLSPNALQDGLQIIVEGVHFLQDGEAVQVIQRD